MQSKEKAVFLSPYKTFLVGFLGFAQGVIFLLPYISSQFYIPMMEMLGCTNEQLNQLMSAYGFVMFLTVIPGGWIADRFETRKLVAISLMLHGVGGVVLTFILKYQVYFVMWIFFSAVCNLFYWSAAIKFIRIVATDEEQGKAYGYSYALNGISTVLFATIGSLIMIMFGDGKDIRALRVIIFVYSLANLIVGIAILPIYKNIKLGDGRTLKEEEKPSFKEMLSVLTLKETWVFSFLCFCLYTLNTIMPHFFTPFFTDVIGVTPTISSVLYVVAQIVGIISPVLAGIFADRIGSVIKTITYVTIIAIAITGVMSFAFSLIPLWAAVLIEVLAVFFIGGAYSIQFSAFDEIKLDRKIAGSCVAMASMIGYSADIFVWDLFGSFIDKYDNTGYLYIFISLLLLACLAFVVSIVLGRWAKNNAQAQASQKAIL